MTSFIQKGFAVAACAAVPFLAAPASVDASTVTGSVTGTINGTISYNDPDGWLSITGSFTSFSTLSDENALSPLGWRAEGTTTLFDADNSTVVTVDSDPTPRSAQELAIQYLFTEPTASKFTVGAFLLFQTVQSLNAGAAATGNDFFGFTADWTIENAILEVEPAGSTLGADFAFLFTDEGDKDNLAFLFGSYVGVPGFTFPSSGAGDFTSNLTLAPIPVPAALPLLAGGLGLLALMGWRQRRQA